MLGGLDQTFLFGTLSSLFHVSFKLLSVVSVFLDDSGVRHVLDGEAEDLLQVLNLDFLIGLLAVRDLFDLLATDEQFEPLGVLGVENILSRRREHH